MSLSLDFICRYGAPGQIQSIYMKFAEQYMAHFAIPILNAFLGVLHIYHSGDYVSSRVLHSALRYIDTALTQSRTWRVVKPYAQVSFK